MDLSFENWLSDLSNYGWWELPAVLSAVLYVILAAKKNKWCFLFGLISSSIYVYLTLELKLYFDSFINAYYIVMSFYGWIVWNNNEANDDLPIKSLGWKNFLTYSALLLLVSLLFGWWASVYTDDSLPYWDAFTTVFALVATYWVVKKLVENWIIWIIVDLCSTVIYLYKGLPLTSLLFFTYTVIAIYGYKNWRRQIAI